MTNNSSQDQGRNEKESLAPGQMGDAQRDEKNRQAQQEQEGKRQQQNQDNAQPKQPT